MLHLGGGCTVHDRDLILMTDLQRRIRQPFWRTMRNMDGSCGCRKRPKRWCFSGGEEKLSAA